MKQAHKHYIFKLPFSFNLFRRVKVNRSLPKRGISGTRRREIDGFRALAVLMVVTSHLGLRRVPGQLGVLLFFVISGYVITGSILREYRHSGRFSATNFFGRRALKLMPPLFLIIFLPSIFILNELSDKLFMSQLFFYFNWYYPKTFSFGILPGSGVVWSLSVEEQYYILIAITVALISRLAKHHFLKLLTFTYLLIYFASLLSRVVHFLTSNSRNSFGDVSRILYGTDTRVSSIAMGGILSIYLQSNDFLKKHTHFFSKFKFPIYLFAIIILLISIFLRNDFFRNTLKYTMQEFVCVIMILFVSIDGVNYKFINSFLNWSWMQLIGKASYSIYLSHLVLYNFINE